MKNPKNASIYFNREEHIGYGSNVKQNYKYVLKDGHSPEFQHVGTDSKCDINSDEALNIQIIVQEIFQAVEAMLIGKQFGKGHQDYEAWKYLRKLMVQKHPIAKHTYIQIWRVLTEDIDEQLI